MDYGEARFILSRYLVGKILIVSSVSQPDLVYMFQNKKDGQFVCMGCLKHKKNRTVTVVDGRIIGRKHPADDHHPECLPVAESTVQVLEMDRQMRATVKETGKRPREAYNEVVESVCKKFKSSIQQAAIITQFPSFQEVHRQLARHREARNIPVPDVLNIPDLLRVTLRGRDVAADDVNFNERFLLHTGIGGELLVFCADTELTLMHKSEYLISIYRLYVWMYVWM